MKIAVPAEADDTRVAATPETVKKFVALGSEVHVQAGAGAGSRITDAEYAAAGAIDEDGLTRWIRDNLPAG